MAEVVLEGVSKFFPAPAARRMRCDGSIPARRAATGPVVAVRNLSLTIGDGELVVLVGPSGSGKTTVLRLIAGLESPDQGTIRISGRVVNGLPPRERNIAMVFQSYALYPHMSVGKNLAFGAEARTKRGWLGGWFSALAEKTETAAVERIKIQDRVRQTAHMLGIEELLDRRPGHLSGGERQRAALGRALMRAPDAFLLDEPLASLDAPLRVELRRELRGLHRRIGSTMLYVTHDQVEALTLGDRIGVLHRGELQQVGAPQEIYERPRNQFVAGFFGAGGMNFIAGEFISTGGGIQFEGPGVTVPLPLPTFPASRPDSLADYVGRPVVLGVRPEDVLLKEAGAVGEEAAARVRVSLVEFIGDAFFVHADVDCSGAPAADRGAHAAANFPKLIIKTEARSPIRPGDVRDAVFHPSKVHWFDGQTGERLVAFAGRL